LTRRHTVIAAALAGCRLASGTPQLNFIRLTALGATIAAGALALTLAATPAEQTVPISPPAAVAAGPKWVTGFYVGYQASSYPPNAIDFSALTHIVVFAALPRENATLDTALFVDPENGPKLAQDIARRAHAAGRKALLAIGGSGSQRGFAGATTPQTIGKFVGTIGSTIDAWGFDGVDVDWEPLPQGDYAAMLDLVRLLKAARPGVIVTTDVGWQKRGLTLSGTESRFYSQLAATVDQMNMMTYGMADNWGGWSVWHSSALAGDGPDHPTSVVASARAYLGAGVPAARLGLGIGFYGSCWSEPAAAPLQAPGAARVVAGDNDMGTAAIARTYYRAANYHYDAQAQAPYLSFAAPTGPHKCTFISYEDESSVATKGRFATEAGLGGAIIWQLNEGYDAAAAKPNALLRAVGQAFGVRPAASR
jgi:chitinase